MSILIAGGAGYIGSHTAIDLLEAGYEVVIVDDYSNSSPVVIDRIESLSGKKVKVYEQNLLDTEALNKVFDQEKIEAVIHFAAFKAVGESVQKPIEYYKNNLGTLMSVLEAMKAHDVKKIIYSSSATVYGAENPVPYVETMPIGEATNPYGVTKIMSEKILKDVYTADKEWSVILLRYFNPIGAHQSGEIGEDPSGIPNNIMPYVTQVAIGKLDHLNVFGHDYDTVDGTGVRDYIHVLDLASGHVAAVDYALNHSGVEAINLGTGKGYSVLELVKSFERVNGVKVPYEFTERREGDLAIAYADPSYAKKLLGWEAKYDLDDMVRDSWNWQSKNPDGYR